MSNTYITGEQTKKNILKESKKLFYKKGYTNTTYSDISATAKINRALIPYHFKNKQVLGTEIYHQIIDEFQSLIDNLLDTSQFDTDFVAILHTVAYYRLLATNSQLVRFLSELQADEGITLFDTTDEKNWIVNLGAKFSSLPEQDFHILTQMHIGVKKEMVTLLCNHPKDFNPDTISSTHIHMLMRYAGYTTKKTDELINAAIEIVNLLTFEIKNGFAVELKYN